MKNIPSFGIEYYLAIICLIFAGCNSQEYVEFETSLSSKQLNFETQTTDTVHLDAFYAVGFPRSLRKINGDTYLGYLNTKEKRLSIHNITQDSGIAQIQLSLQDSFVFHGNGGTASIYLQSLDGIFIYHDNLISLLNSQGEVIWNMNAAPVIHNGMVYDFVFRNNNMPLYYDHVENSLSAEVHCMKCTWVDELESSVGSRVALDGGVGFVPIQLSKRYASDSSYAGLSETYRLTVDNLDHYTFPLDPNIYSFDRYSGEIKVNGGRSSYQKELAKTFRLNDSLTPYENLFNYTMESGYYSFNVLNDSYRNLFYRFYIGGTSAGKRKNGKDKNLFDKPVVLMVFDKNWALIEEIPLGSGKSYTIQAVFVDENGLYIDRWVDNNHMVFDKYSVNITTTNQQ